MNTRELQLKAAYEKRMRLHKQSLTKESLVLSSSILESAIGGQEG
jgi:hypothetical protein